MRGARTRGFTLIELLVIIAIVGVLSAVVLASLNSSRAKAQDAQIKAYLHTVTTQAALDYGGFPDAYTYSAWAFQFSAVTPAQLQAAPPGTGTPGAPDVSVFLTAAKGDPNGEEALLKAALVGGMLYFGVTPSAYFVAVPLVSAPNTFWCVDSTGAAKQENATPTPAAYASLTCP